MADDSDQIVRSIGRELVSRVAPEELPLYPSLASQFDGQHYAKRRGSSDDQLLGFGGAEVLVFLTPIILSFAKSFWHALTDDAANSAATAVLQRLRALCDHKHETSNAPHFTPEQIKLVRTVAEREAHRLSLSDDQVSLLSDAMVGVLTGAAVS
jgi:hypothetical protein